LIPLKQGGMNQIIICAAWEILGVITDIEWIKK